MTPADLTAAGRALYGERWKHALGKALFPGKKPATSERMIHRWLSGATAMPDDLLDRIFKIAQARQEEILMAMPAIKFTRDEIEAMHEALALHVAEGKIGRGPRPRPPKRPKKGG